MLGLEPNDLRLTTYTPMTIRALLNTLVVPRDVNNFCSSLASGAVRNNHGTFWAFRCTKCGHNKTIADLKGVTSCVFLVPGTCRRTRYHRRRKHSTGPRSP